jgi:hypothetical protein
MSAYNPRITIESPFAKIEVPTLYVWLERIWDVTVGEDVPTDLAEWMTYQLDRMESVKTWGVYRDGIIGGYIEATPCRATAPLPEKIARVSVVFKRDMWGLSNTATALRLALHELFSDGAEMVVFPVLKNGRGIKELFRSVGAENIGIVPTDTLRRDGVESELFLLPVLEWERKNAQFLREFESTLEVYAEAV